VTGERDRPDVTRGEFAALCVATVAVVVLLCALIVTPYPTADVCLVAAAVALLVGMLACATFALSRWKRGVL
jgi:multisubunit Na+/H+ antiporter MnhB subunit